MKEEKPFRVPEKERDSSRTKDLRGIEYDWK